MCGALESLPGGQVLANCVTAKQKIDLKAVLPAMLARTHRVREIAHAPQGPRDDDVLQRRLIVMSTGLGWKATRSAKLHFHNI